MEAGDTRLCDSVFRKMYCCFGNDGQVPWAKAVFYSHLGCYTDNTLVYQLLWVAHLKISSPHIQGSYSGNDLTENISDLNKIKCSGSFQNNLQRTVTVLDVDLHIPIAHGEITLSYCICTYSNAHWQVLCSLMQWDTSCVCMKWV